MKIEQLLSDSKHISNTYRLKTEPLSSPTRFQKFHVTPNIQTTFRVISEFQKMVANHYRTSRFVTRLKNECKPTPFGIGSDSLSVMCDRGISVYLQDLSLSHADTKSVYIYIYIYIYILVYPCRQK